MLGDDDRKPDGRAVLVLTVFAGVAGALLGASLDARLSPNDEDEPSKLAAIAIGSLAGAAIGGTLCLVLGCEWSDDRQ